MPSDIEVVPGANSSLRRRIARRLVRAGRNACWGWSGKVARKADGNKRPQIQLGKRGSPFINAARVILALRDRVPLSERKGLHAGHKCGNWWCVNGRHLMWQTCSENQKMKAVHKRQRAAA